VYTYKLSDFTIKYLKVSGTITPEILPDILFLRPQNVEIDTVPMSCMKRIFYRLTESEKNSILKIDGFGLKHIPLHVMDAVLSTKDDDKVRMLEPNVAMHIKTASLAGISNYWGIPPLVSIFKSVWNVAKLRWLQLNIIENRGYPITVVFPAPNTDGMFSTTNLGTLKDNIKNAIENNREGKFDQWITSDVPVGTSYLGGDAKALQLTNELRLAMQEMSTLLGLPFELLIGTSAQWSATSAFIRLIEKRLSPLFNGLKAFCRIFARHLTGLINDGSSGNKIVINLKPLKVLDDVLLQKIRSNLVMNNRASLSNFLESIGLDPEKELGSIEDDAIKVAKAIAAQNKVIQDAGIDAQLQSKITQSDFMSAARTGDAINPSFAQDIQPMPDQKPPRREGA